MEMWKLIQVALLAAFKYVFTLPYALFIGIDHTKAVIAIISGGIIGFFFFYYLSGWIICRYKRLIHVLWGIVPSSMCQFTHNLYIGPKTRKAIRINKKSRFIASLKRRWGLLGIVVITPVFLSIPIGAFLANKYYRRDQRLVPYMMFSIIGWGMIISLVMSFIK